VRQCDRRLDAQRRGAGVAGAMLVAAALAACGRDAPQPPAAETPRRGGTLRVAVMRGLDAPYWITGMDGTTEHFVEHVVPPLARIDAEGRQHPYLAGDVLDGGYEILFPLRAVRWSDGARVVAADFVLTATLLRDPRAHSPERPRIDLLASATAVNDSLLRLEYSTPYAQRIRHALLWPMPSHLWSQAQDPGTWAPDIACGPFRVTTADARRLVLVRHDGSGLEPAFLDTIRIDHLAPGDAARAFQAGAIDVIDDPPPAQVERLRGMGARIIALVGRSYVFVGWNLRDGRWRDVAVRRAMAQAVDLDDLMRRWTLGQGSPARGPLVPAQAFADTHAVLPFDRRAAMRALDAAGYVDSDGDGVRDRRGARLAFHILAPAVDSVRIGIAADVARALRSVGVGAMVQALPPHEMLQRLEAGAFEAFIGEWFPNLGLNLDAVWRSEAGDRFNYGGFADRGVDSLLTLLWQEYPRPGRDAVMAALQARVYAAQPYLFLFQMPHFLVLDPRVRGADPDVVSPFWNLPEWWLEPRSERRRGARRLAGRGRAAHLGGGRRARGGVSWRPPCCV
jgi:peptide/nickel transport system substrate-binding protein